MKVANCFNTMVKLIEDPLYLVTVRKVTDRGTIEQHPIHEGYTVKGFTYYLPAVGESFVVARVERNGIKIPGIFGTSVVREVEIVAEDLIRFTTENSVYECSFKPAPEDDDEG